MQVRLQRFLAQAGVASRRKAETLITDGRVRVNGRVVTELGTKVDPVRDEVVVGGRSLKAEEPVYLLLNKPKGYVTTVSDPEGRPTVMELVRKADGARVYPVGRLDFNTEGLLVLTNDGDLAHALMHPKREVRKTYEVKLQGLIAPDQLAAWQRGVVLDDGERAAPAEARILGNTGKNSWVEVTIHEGRNRQIHRMAEAIGFAVLKLQRVRYAGLELTDLKPGACRRLTLREVDELRRAAGLAKPRPKREPHRPKREPERRERAKVERKRRR
jgi:23S rRNA pseudouridine2605 synthase